MKKLVAIVLLTGSVFLSLARAEIGAAAPALELSDLNGKTFNLQKFAGERPVILAFLASWSKSCQAELLDLQEMYQSRGKNLAVAAVSFDKKQKDLLTFVADHEITLPVLPDKKLTTLDRFQILILPTTFCVNREGIVEKIFVDYDENVKKEIIEWLKS